MSGTTDNNIAYFDANIWVAFMLGKSDQNFSFASQLIDEMYNYEHPVYVSDLVLLETVSSIRRKIPEWMKIPSHTEHHPQNMSKVVKQHIKEKIQEFFTLMSAFEKEGKIMNKNPNMSIKKIHQNAFSCLTAYFGKIHEQGKHYRYSGLNHWDFQHALIAKGLRVNVFYTADLAFQELEKMQQFASIRFVTRTSDIAWEHV